MSPSHVLIGPPGSGKTSVGRALASSLGVDHRDSDADVERLAGASVSEIFVSDGEARFRKLEREAIAVAMIEHEGVLSLGGGAVLDDSTRDLLETYRDGGGNIIFLTVSLPVASRRVGLNAARPLLMGNPRKQWQDLLDARLPIYTRLATATIDTDHGSAGEIAARILESA